MERPHGFPHMLDPGTERSSLRNMFASRSFIIIGSPWIIGRLRIPSRIAPSPSGL